MSGFEVEEWVVGSDGEGDWVKCGGGSRAHRTYRDDEPAPSAYTGGRYKDEPGRETSYAEYKMEVPQPQPSRRRQNDESYRHYSASQPPQGRPSSRYPDQTRAHAEPYSPYNRLHDELYGTPDRSTPRRPKARGKGSEGYVYEDTGYGASLRPGGPPPSRSRQPYGYRRSQGSPRAASEHYGSSGPGSHTEESTRICPDTGDVIHETVTHTYHSSSAGGGGSWHPFGESAHPRDPRSRRR